MSASPPFITIGPPPDYEAPPIPTASASEPVAPMMTSDSDDEHEGYDESAEAERFAGLVKKKPLKLGGRLGHLKSYHRTKSNSTSTLYVNSTVSTPDVDELLRCTANKIHVVVIRGQASVEKTYFDIFDERTHPISNEYIDYDKVPEVMEIYSFIETIFTAERLSHECAIMMLAYIERIVELTGVTVDSTNWRRVLLSTLILASKVWEDQAVWNVDFLSVFPQVTVKDLGQLEKVLLRLLQYNVSLKSSVYTKYFFELRSFAERDARNFPLEPLDKIAAARLEQRSKSEEDKAKADAGPGAAGLVRSKSLTQLERNTKSPPVILN